MINTIKLQALIYRSLLRTSLIPLLVIELLLLTLYFGINTYIAEKNRLTLISEVKLSLSEITLNEAKRVDLLLQEISRSTRILQIDHQNFFISDRCFSPNGDPAFTTHANGAFYKTNSEGASLYYSGSTEIGSSQYRKAFCSESLDLLLKAIVDTNPSITQAYINTEDGMNRIYPFIDDAPLQYGANVEMANYNFYYEADGDNNPERDSVWTEVYLDPAGQGWMLSNLVPIYNGDVLEGVTGVDVTVESFIETILNHNFPWESASLIIDRNGMILAMQDSAEQLFGLSELTNHKYISNVNNTVTKPKLYKFENQKYLPSEKVNLLLNQNTSLEIDINGSEYLIDSKVIYQTGWQIITLIPTNAFLSPIENLKKLSFKLGTLTIATMVIFYIFFFIYLNWKSKCLSVEISHPIEALIYTTNQLGSRWTMGSTTNSRIEEIQKLNINFDKLLIKLKIRTERLVRSALDAQAQKDKEELLRKLAETDSLTKVANRLKLDKVLLEKHQEAARCTGKSYGILLIDIDYFKRVNDVFGHLSGDKVLEEIAQIITSTMREEDSVGRWGGEEFLVICTTIDKEALLDLAERLRMTIAAHHFVINSAVTISIGAATYSSRDSVESILHRADKALYQAKGNGRNAVVYYSTV